MLASMLEYDKFVGRILTGRVHTGSVKVCPVCSVGPLSLKDMLVYVGERCGACT